MSTAHVTIDGPAMLCNGCGAIETLTYPAPVEAIVRQARDFMDAHRACRPVDPAHDPDNITCPCETCQQDRAEWDDFRAGCWNRRPFNGCHLLSVEHECSFELCPEKWAAQR